MTSKSPSPQWKPLNGVDQASLGHLLGALLTTFDPPDAGVLIESYLPRWLGLDGACTDEGDDRLRYFAELEDALRRIRGRLAIFSSPGTIRSSADGWIWNYIHRFEVGAVRQATQHAKLWMFHRAAVEAGGAQTLEIVISSANLTHDGLHGQIQSAWRCVVTLDATAADANGQSWGCLPGFLSALGKSAGLGGPKVARQWVELLRRCACPAGADLVASIPGQHSATTLEQPASAWGTAGLRLLWKGKSARQLGVVVPTIGRWTCDGFAQWAEAAGVSPRRISLGWLSPRHLWSKDNHWQLDAASEQALTEAGIRWLEIPNPENKDWESPFCAQHQKEDPRWSHAKLYSLHTGQQRRMLVTSANLSQAAWGKPWREGGLEIRNFELGVAFPATDSFSERLQETPYLRFTCEVEYQREEEPPIAWLGAEWDGQTLQISCRANDRLAKQVDVGVARYSVLHSRTVAWQAGKMARATIPWPASSLPVPLVVHVRTRNDSTRTVAVHDVQTTDDARILCGEFDESTLRDAMDALIEEKYGYRSAKDSGNGGWRGSSRTDGAPPSGHYAVPAYVDARRRFLLVDNWWKDLTAADGHARQLILDDGIRISRRWMTAADNQPDPGLATAARVAAEELQMRIEMYKWA